MFTKLMYTMIISVLSINLITSSNCHQDSYTSRSSHIHIMPIFNWNTVKIHYLSWNSTNPINTWIQWCSQYVTLFSEAVVVLLPCLTSILIHFRNFCSKWFIYHWTRLFLATLTVTYCAWCDVNARWFVKHNILLEYFRFKVMLLFFTLYKFNSIIKMKTQLKCIQSILTLNIGLYVYSRCFIKVLCTLIVFVHIFMF